MPTVPTLVNNRQTLAPNGRARQQTRANPNTFGAQIGGALQGVGRGLRNTAAAIDQIRAEEDKATVEEHVNRFSDYARDRTYDPEEGYVNTRGRNAVDLRDSYEDDLEKKRQSFGTDLTPQQRNLYDRATQARQQQALDTSIRHASAERRRWFDDASTARLETFSSDALAMSDEPEKFRLNVAAGLGEIDQQAESRGWSPEQTRRTKNEYLSGIHKNVILKHATSDPLRAQAWLDDNKESLTGETRAELERALHEPVLQVRAQVEAERIALSPNTNRPTRANVNGRVPTEIRTANDNVNTDDIKPETKDAFTKLQQSLGRRLTISSGYRNPLYNKKVGGAENSRHTHGDAVDVDVRGMSKEERLEFIEAAFDAGFTGVGVGSNFIHIDQGNPRAWGYASSAGGGPVPDYAKGLVNKRLASLRVEGGHSAAAQTPDTPSQAQPEFTGPRYIEQQVAGIENPQLRMKTAEALSRIYNRQDADLRRQQRDTKIAAEKFIIANPGSDPTELPLDVQQQLGIEGMNTIWAYNAKIAEQSVIATDEVLYADLTRLQAEDPTQFAEQVDLFDYVDRLSTKDRRDLQQLQAEALRDKRNGTEEALTKSRSISTAMSIADNSLRAAGVKKTGKQADEESRLREARFQSALVQRMREFQVQEKRTPTDFEIQDIVDQLLTPIIIREPGFLFGTNDTEANLFDAPFRDDEATVEIDVPYENIPVDLRLAMREELAIELGRDPTEDEIKAEYVQYVIQGK